MLTSRIGEEFLPLKEVHIDCKRKRGDEDTEVLRPYGFKTKYIKSIVVNDERIKGRLHDILDFINNSYKSNDKDILKRNGLYYEITLKIAKECSIKIQDNESDLDKVIVDSLRNYCKFTTKGSRGPRPKI